MDSIPSLVAEFERFQEELDRSKFKYDFDILADYWNALGTLWEAQAWLRPELKVEFAQRAKIAYEKGLQFTSGWIAAKSNLAAFTRKSQTIFGAPALRRRKRPQRCAGGRCGE